MIRLSRPGDEAALHHLWRVAFGDLQSTIDGFFSRLYRPGDAIVRAEGDTIASAIYLLDAGTMPQAGGTPLRAAYSYALATLPDCRGRGFGSEVTKAAIAHSFDLGFHCNLICPAEERLFAYYLRLGYSDTLSIAEGKTTRAEASDKSIICRIMSTDFSDYSPLRLCHLPACALAYPTPFLRYVALRCEASGGGLYRLESNGLTGCAAVERWGNQLFVREILPAPLARLGTQALLTHLDAETAVFRTRPDGDRDASPARRPFVLMARPAGAEPTGIDGYVPFVLD